MQIHGEKEELMFKDRLRIKDGWQTGSVLGHGEN